jgi:hypothetical protein
MRAASVHREDYIRIHDDLATMETAAKRNSWWLPESHGELLTNPVRQIA